MMKIALDVGVILYVVMNIRFRYFTFLDLLFDLYFLGTTPTEHGPEVIKLDILEGKNRKKDKLLERNEFTKDKTIVI